MSKSMWILVILILISSILAYNNRKEQPWVKCKESLFNQIVFNKCTPSSFSEPQDYLESQDKNNKELNIDDQNY